MKVLESCLPLRDNGVRTRFTHIRNSRAHIRKRTSQTTWLATKSVDAFREYLSGDLAVRKTLA